MARVPVLDRYLASKAVVATLSALLLLWPLVFLASLDDALSRSLVAVRPAMALAVAFVLSTPVVFALAAAGGAAIFWAWLDREDAFTALQIGLRSPASATRWALLPAALLSLSSLALLRDVHPRAVSWLFDAPWLEERDLSAMLRRAAAADGGLPLLVAGEPEGPAGMRDLRLVAAWSAGTVGVAAERARFGLGERGALELDLERGGLDVERAFSLPGRMEFDRARVALDSGLWLPRRAWRHSSSRPAGSLAEDAERAARVAGDDAARMRARYVFEPWWRLIAALQPLLLSAQILAALARSPSAGTRRAPPWIAFLGVTFLTSSLLGCAKALAYTSLPAALAIAAAGAVVPALVVRLVLSWPPRRRRFRP